MDKFLDAPNRFLNGEEYSSVLFHSLRTEFEKIYCDLFKGKVHTFGARPGYSTKIHWSRDWEYPWAVIHSALMAGQKALDCGCGGPPFLPFLALHGVECFGIDMEAAKWMKRSGLKLLIDRFRKRHLSSLRHYEVPPQKVIGRPVRLLAGSITDLPFADSHFDCVFCISVFEHLEKKVASAGLKEMVRVLKEGGRLLITLDIGGNHVNETMSGFLEEIVAISGLRLMGETDYRVPDKDSLPGLYNVAGIVLVK